MRSDGALVLRVPFSKLCVQQLPATGTPDRDACARTEAAYYGEASEQRLPEEERSTEEEFHHLCLNDYRAVKLPMYIDNVTISMEIDTGTAVSCISETYIWFASGLHFFWCLEVQ